MFRFYYTVGQGDWNLLCSFETEEKAMRAVEYVNSLTALLSSDSEKFVIWELRRNDKVLKEGAWT